MKTPETAIPPLQEKYAQILLQTGVNLYPGQNLYISAPAPNLDFAYILADQAYRLGAGYVEIQAKSNRPLRSRLDHSADAHLDYAPDYLTPLFNQLAAEDWAFIALENNEEQDLLQGADSHRLSRTAKAAKQRRTTFSRHIENHQLAWCVAAVPGPEWARKILGTPDPAQLWNLLTPILQLDQPDPAAAWRQKGDLSEERTQSLNALKLQKLHYQSQKTDLTIGLHPEHRWLGAFAQTPSGRSFLPNIPTEEIFTTPDARQTQGRVQITRPLKVLETIVEDAWFEFENGRAVRSGAARNAAVLEQYLALDDGAPYLGEAALVDTASPISRTDRLFHSILYDENASCHIALGAGYPSAFTNSTALNTPQARAAQGCNNSLVHTDFMIGSPDLSITGYDTAGTPHPIMADGRFAF